MKSHTARLGLLLALPALLTLSACSDHGMPTGTPSPAEISAKKAATPLTVPIVGTIDGETVFEGTFTLTQFVVNNGVLSAVGTLAGALTNPLTGVVTQISQTITLPVSNISGSCQILHLELGPLDLDLLGLQVHLDRVVLDITAQRGSGNLLGNLLCGIAGLLDSGGPLSALAQVLNQLLGLLQL